MKQGEGRSSAPHMWAGIPSTIPGTAARENRPALSIRPDGLKWGKH